MAAITTLVGEKWKKNQTLCGVPVEPQGPPPSNSLVYSWAATSPHSPAGPHLFGFVNATELPSYLHRDRGRAWKWILGLGKKKTISKEAKVDDPDPRTRKAQGDLPATYSDPRLTPDTLR